MKLHQLYTPLKEIPDGIAFIQKLQQDRYSSLFAKPKEKKKAAKKGKGKLLSLSPEQLNLLKKEGLL